MDLVSLRRQHILWSIQQNPTTIMIKRTEKVNMDGYFEEKISDIGPMTVRIFQQRKSIPQGLSSLAGTKYVDNNWGMLVDYQAAYTFDIYRSEITVQSESTIKDEFDVPGLGHFIIKAVYPQVIQGQLVGYQADLEKVS